MATGCDSESAPADADGGIPRKFVEKIEPPATRPEYSIPPDLREKHPGVAAFLDDFLLTCLDGDYSGYRELVSRRRDPESPERFTAIYHAIREVTVESIEAIKLPGLEGPVYRVTSSAELRPDAKVELRKKNRDIAILVFQENGTWRMAPAPADLQPGDVETATKPNPPASEPPPDYPWDQDGDD